MASLNIHLSPEDTSALRTLEREGVSVPEFVRDAIRRKASTYGKRKPMTVKQAKAALARIIAETPGPPMEYIQLGIKSTDRKAMRAYMRAKITRKPFISEA